jgi:flavin-dependent dehydrogenase
MVVLDDGYCGLAPVGSDRVNVGIVVGRAGASLLRAGGARALLRHVLATLPPPAAPDAMAPDPDAAPLDHLAGAAPLAHRVIRRAGPSWLVVGDAAGFLDPFTGEGLHRALVSARLAAPAIEARLAGRPDALGDYDRVMTRRFVGKDIVTALIQSFLGRPALLRYAVRRLADRPAVRERLELVVADLAPPSHVLDPRVLLRALAP